MSSAGDIIILNGASSSGKSALARALQECFEEPYLHVEGDAFWGMAPDGYLRGLEPEEFQRRYRRLERGCFGSVNLLASLGANVILDVVLEGSVFAEEAHTAFGASDAVLVSVFCPIETLRSREAKRGDRRIGLAEAQFSFVYENNVYDIRVDTVADDPGACAERIRTHIESGAPRGAVRRLGELL